MLTNNWYTHFKGVLCGVTKATNVTSVQITDCDGIAHNPRFATGSYESIWAASTKSLSTSKGYAGVYFGDGTVAPTKEDYWLSGNLITTLSSAGVTQAEDYNGDTVTQTLVFTLKNTGPDTVTISEAAWCEKFYTAASAQKSFMFDRVLLSSPVTIAAGETGVVMYKRSITLPT